MHVGEHVRAWRQLLGKHLQAIVVDVADRPTLAVASAGRQTTARNGVIKQTGACDVSSHAPV
jgi:hypothetical protein